ncbi:UNKNOWN [Stylonychia lemnae]|uniref:PHR domain-containing protein n=1 Tax=Stylonychia lemnae TaxID=5949 RepID=A0A078AZK9_STYLE|nr:UNKNOWN [Stylonychia lemnae]|eukprot:CDW86637.1 UNKNOWN [Stylonychia lemnae]
MEIKEIINQDIQIISTLKIGNFSKLPIAWRDEGNIDQLPVARYNETLEKEIINKIKITNWRRDDDILIQKMLNFQQLRSNKVVYTDEYGYVKLDKRIQQDKYDTQQLNPPKINTTWSCSTIQYPVENQTNIDGSTQKSKIVSVDQNDFKFMITVNTVCVIDQEESEQIHRVKISDQILSIVEQLQKLHECKIKVIYNNRELDQRKTFRAANIKDGQKLLFFGIKDKCNQDQKPIRFFLRFPDFNKEQQWKSVEGDDGIIITCKVDFIFLGIGLFEASNQDPGEFGIQYTIYIKDKQGNVKLKPQVVKENGSYTYDDVDEMHVFKYKFQTFPHGIVVKAGQRLTYMQRTSYQYSFYSDQGRYYQQIRNPDMNIFKIKSTRLSSGTCVEQGIIPGFLYKLL